jgi:ABC-2 type transport system permease protein
MNLLHVFRLIRKDLHMGPRSPVFVWALIFPFVITLVVRGIFGGLLAPEPRLGIVDEGRSLIALRAQELDGIALTRCRDLPQLKQRVADNDLDAGLFLKKGFDRAVVSGEKPLLEFWISGQSLASHRIVLAMATMDLIRGVEGKKPPVKVVVHTTGENDGLPLAARLIPFMVLFSLLIAGVLVTAFGLVQERENRTLEALLVTPIRFSEILAAKAGIGLILGVLMSLLTLLLNNAVGSHPFLLSLVLFLAALMAVEIGLMFGLTATNVKGLFTLMKTVNMVILAPVIFFIFPHWPQWIAKIFPTYWIIRPVFEMAVSQGGLSEISVDLTVTVAIVTFLILPIRVLSAKRRG